MKHHKNKQKSSISKIYKRVLIAMIPAVMLFGMMTMFMLSVIMYFSNQALSENLTSEQNSKLFDLIKSESDSIKKDYKDYYGTDRKYSLDYNIVLAYVKYDISVQDGKSYEELESEIKRVVLVLKPQFTYKTDKIITIREYKENVKDLDGNEHEEVRVERKEEEAHFLTNAKTLKKTIEISYEIKTDTTTNGDEKITVTKPVISSMKQTDKEYDVLKQIIANNYKNEDVNNATEVILAAAASFKNENVTADMIFTGGTSGGTVVPESFTGGQAEFIDKISAAAIKQYEKYHILPSITITQAILESGWGQSGLTEKGNNLFGIKAYGWDGPVVVMMTREVYNGVEQYVPANFRAYPSWDDSIEDHSRILMQSNFEAVRNATNYTEAANALASGGYATDPNYAQLIISFVEQYGLYKYDK